MNSTAKKIMLRCYHPEDQDCTAEFIVIEPPAMLQETVQKALKTLEELGASEISWNWYINSWELRDLGPEADLFDPSSWKYEDTEPYDGDEIAGVHLHIYQNGEFQFQFPYTVTESYDMGFTNCMTLKGLENV